MPRVEKQAQASSRSVIWQPPAPIALVMSVVGVAGGTNTALLNSEQWSEVM